MSDAKIDNELMLRVAEAMETAGAGYRDVKADMTALRQDVTAMRGELSSNSNSLASAHSRLKRIESSINGEGQDKGIKTRLELIDRDLEALKGSVNDLNVWRSGLNNDQIAELKADKKHSRVFNLQLWLTIGAMTIAFASAAASCGPQVVKAWGDGKTAMAKEARP